MIVKIQKLLQGLNYISLGVPIGVLFVSAVFPLRPIVSQAMIGILLVWFGVEVMLGFPFIK